MIFYIQLEIKNYNIDDIICIDETSINSLQLRHHCYNEVGKICVIKTNSQEVFKKYTGVFAISIKGVIGYELYNKGGIDSDRLLIFLERFITNKYKNKVIILDNASSHRNIRVKELINKNNKLIYSVPYPPLAIHKSPEPGDATKEKVPVAESTVGITVALVPLAI